MAPASVLAHNLLEPYLLRQVEPGRARQRRALRLQRIAVLLITAASVALAASGRSAYELVEDAYAMSLVGMFVPFVAGIYHQGWQWQAAVSAMLVGMCSWLLHVVCGWDNFAEPVAGQLAVPHELIDTLLSGVAFFIGHRLKR